jgi:hypothetical protein
VVMKPLDPKATHTYLTIKLTCIVSPWPLSRTYQCIMSYNAINLISFLDTWLYKSLYYLINQHTISQKFQNVFHDSCKICMFDIYKMDVQCKKSNNKHPCEFVLTQVVSKAPS